ncbi:MAG: methyl-accepting chemotaxis protein [Candidatus Sulfotelmatobacter sp.]
MQWFRHLKISKKLGLGFGMVLLLMVGLGIFSIRQLAKVNDATVNLATNLIPGMRALANMRFRTVTLRRKELNLLLSNKNELDSSKNEITSTNGQLAEDSKIYERLIASDEERGIYEDYRSSLAKYSSLLPQVVKLAEAGQHDEAIKFSQGEGRVALDAALEKVGEEIQLSMKHGDMAANRAAAAYSASRYWVVSLVAGGVLLTVIFTITITRAISVPVYETMSVLECLAARDLTKTVDINSNDELGTMASALNRTIAALRGTMATISQSAEQLASASEEISAGAGQTAEGARVQSDQTTQVATAMQEMAATVQDISANSNNASEASRGAADAARNGGKMVEQTLSTMRGIADSSSKVASTIGQLGKSSEQIGKIISVIDDIADQTNLLALNAAIEAARAGEQGRGFAVVADEVRKLAERTTSATKEIASMIESIQNETKNAVQAMQQGSIEVQLGVEKTSASGTALEEIIKMSEHVGDMISTIATAATEQSATTEQINSSVSQISSSTQASSAASEQTAKACTDLSSLAFDLQNLVSQFKLESGAVHIGNKTGNQGDTRSKAAAAGA